MSRSSVALMPASRKPFCEKTSNPEGCARVLVIEDERIVAADLQRTLRDLGYNAYASAPTAARALAIAAETPPDVVLADVRIEGPVDGIDAAFELHSQYGHRRGVPDGPFR
jgi:CheY-like chemotaxis protein